MDKPPSDPELKPLEALVGEWETEAPHPDFGLIKGRSKFEWLPGGGFLVQTSVPDHPDFPNSISLIGPAQGGGYEVHYYDSRGVRRVLDMTLENGEWRMSREAEAPDFSQRWIGKFEDDETIAGHYELTEPGGSEFKTDFHLTYKRAG